LKKQYLEAKICNVIDYSSFLTLQTGNITLVKFGGMKLTSQKSAKFVGFKSSFKKKNKKK